MTRAACRCGQILTLPGDGTERIVCPSCGARVRIRPRTPGARPAARPAPPADGFLRFFCPCGRRLKVDAARPPAYGKCPDCDRVVPVPEPGEAASAAAGGLPPGHPESPTQELNAADLAQLEAWTQRHLGPNSHVDASPPPPVPSPGSDPDRPTPAALPVDRPSDRIEAGLRICPRCGQPVHLGAVACRECGAHVPRR